MPRHRGLFLSLVIAPHACSYSTLQTGGCTPTGDDERVADSPYTIRVLPLQPVTRKSTVSGAGRKQATAGQPAEFYVEGRDQYGNRYLYSTQLCYSNSFTAQTLMGTECMATKLYGNRTCAATGDYVPFKGYSNFTAV